MLRRVVEMLSFKHSVSAKQAICKYIEHISLPKGDSKHVKHSWWFWINHESFQSIKYLKQLKHVSPPKELIKQLLKVGATTHLECSWQDGIISSSKTYGNDHGNVFNTRPEYEEYLSIRLVTNDECEREKSYNDLMMWVWYA